MVKVWPGAPASSRNVTGHTGLGEMYLRQGPLFTARRHAVV
jgi:hypothetical protein